MNFSLVKLIKSLAFLVFLFSIFYLIKVSIHTSKKPEIVSQNSHSSLTGAIVIDGSFNDGGFNEGFLLGMQKAEKDLGYKPIYKENSKASEYPGAFNSVMEFKPDLIIGGGYKLEEETRRQARENPAYKFLSIEGNLDEKPSQNLIVVEYAIEEAAFLAGYAAALVSQSGKIGFVGGTHAASVLNFDFGYQAGAYYARKDIEILNQYTETFFDVAKGHSIADLMMQNGVDVILQAAGPSGIGVIEAVKEKQENINSSGKSEKVWVMGADIDQSKLAPSVVLTSVVKRLDNTVYQFLDKVKQGNFQGGQHLRLGLADKAVGLSGEILSSSNQNIFSQIEKVKDQIIDGTIKVPHSQKELKTFIESLSL